MGGTFQGDRIVLSSLKRANPDLNIIRPNEAAFACYGRNLDTGEWRELADLAAKSIEANRSPAYIASVPELEGRVPVGVLNDCYGDEPVQIGICRGCNDRMNGMEWHDCPEVFIAVTPLMLLLGRVDDLRNGTWDSSLVDGCFLEAGEAVIMNSGTLHLAPCRVSEDPFLSIIILARGVNSELEEAAGDDPLLWKRRKWLIVHPQSPQAGLGACIGISGKNIAVSF